MCAAAELALSCMHCSPGPGHRMHTQAVGRCPPSCGNAGARAPPPACRRHHTQGAVKRPPPLQPPQLQACTAQLDLPNTQTHAHAPPPAGACQATAPGRTSRLLPTPPCLAPGQPRPARQDHHSALRIHSRRRSALSWPRQRAAARVRRCTQPAGRSAKRWPR